MFLPRSKWLSNGSAPVLAWLKDVLKQDRKGYARCVARIQQLADLGHELRRPAADFLRDGVYELRAKHVRVQYRILYFFSGQNVAILAHAFAKNQDRVPPIDIERVTQRKKRFEANPDLHGYMEDISNDNN